MVLHYDGCPRFRDPVRAKVGTASLGGEMEWTAERLQSARIMPDQGHRS
jgi:hypothetical protein